MEDISRHIFFLVTITVACCWWFYSEKNNTIRKHIILLCCLVIITVSGYIIGRAFEIDALAFLVVILLVLIPLVYIRILVLKNRLKNKVDPPE